MGYSHCPTRFLNWNHRKHRILKDVLAHECDIISLQELETKAFKGYLEPEMAKAGYSGLFKPKSRARTMTSWDSVDGCGLFYRPSKLQLVEERWIESQSEGMKRYEAEFSDCP